MRCPKCFGKAYIRDTVNVHDERLNSDDVYRKRICGSCGHTFYTAEFEVEETPEFHEMWARSKAH
jgi:transcriptional regulator NrdR family protein